MGLTVPLEVMKVCARGVTEMSAAEAGRGRKEAAVAVLRRKARRSVDVGG